MNIQKKLKLFFEEKGIPYERWTIEVKDEKHIIDNDVIIDHIVNVAPENEQREILTMLTKIDFYNGNVNHFLHYLAKCLIVQRYQEKGVL